METAFSARIYALLRQIPRGRVITYGQLAAWAGRPGAARAVGNILHANTDPDGIPCFRVVSAGGETAEHFGCGGRAEQERRLKNDGIEVVNGRVSLEKYGMKPEERP